MPKAQEMTFNWVEDPQYSVVIFTCPLNQSNVNPVLLKPQKMGLLLQREMQLLRVADRLAQFVDTWKRSLGAASHQRIQNTLCLFTQSEHNANKASVSLRPGSSGEGGTPVSTGKGSCSPSDRSQGKFLLQPFPGTQEEW